MTDLISTQQSRQEITELLALYCRSLDRMDPDLMSVVFHPDAVLRYPKFEGSQREFVDWVWALHQAYEIHSHQMSNVIIRFAADGRTAASESYVSASFWTPAGQSTANFADAPDAAGGAVVQTPGTQTEVRGRYVDEWSYADGRWAIDFRLCIVDMKTEATAAGLIGTGRRDCTDPSYSIEVTRDALSKAQVSA